MPYVGNQDDPRREPLSAPPARPSFEGIRQASVDQRLAWPVVLVSMPFMDIDRPSIQLGLLNAIAKAHDFPSRTMHANLDFAARIGEDYYRALSEHRGVLLGDWLFSLAAFGDTAPDPDSEFLDEFSEKIRYLSYPWADLRARLLKTRHQDVPAYLKSIAEDVVWNNTRLVGFTSTFQQNSASLALARLLKERYPNMIILFGGANFDGDMGVELVRSFDWIDGAVAGEGDLAFPRLLSALAMGDDPSTIPGLVWRSKQGVTVAPASRPLVKLDDLPVPDYDEYFDRAEATGVQPTVAHRDVWIPFEAARGCWWGAKHHCTFCGLNGNSMTFRAKSPGRLINELAEQARRYRSFRFEAVDNILDMHYLSSLLPALIESAADYELFYEVKANLTRPQLRLMAQAGLNRIQPGLESLSSNVLNLMRKGVGAAQNVNLLRWARFYDIDVAWNILYGFPGETEQDYAAQAAIIPHLVHLQPPAAVTRIWLERFSPLYTEPDTFGLLSRAPERSYEYVYPSSVNLERIAYFFEYILKGALPDSTYADVRQAVTEWSEAWAAERSPELKYWSAPNFVQIYDGRHKGREGTFTFEGTLANIYLGCSDRPTTASQLRRKLGLNLNDAAIEELLGEFAQAGLMFLDGSRALALALPSGAQR
jgi:ribosomal peptide maturation radical SAM protein 1